MRLSGSALPAERAAYFAVGLILICVPAALLLIAVISDALRPDQIGMLAIVFAWPTAFALIGVTLSSRRFYRTLWVMLVPQAALIAAFIAWSYA